MVFKRSICLLFCLGIFTQVLANPTMPKLDDNRLESSKFIQPGQSADFKLLVDSEQSILKINGETYRYGKLDFLELVSTKNACVTASGLELNNNNVGDITVSNGQRYQKSLDGMPGAFLLRCTISSDTVLVEDGPDSAGNGLVSAEVPNFDRSDVPVVPAPGAILLGACGLLILSRVRKIV